MLIGQGTSYHCFVNMGGCQSRPLLLLAGLSARLSPDFTATAFEASFESPDRPLQPVDAWSIAPCHVNDVSL